MHAHWRYEDDNERAAGAGSGAEAEREHWKNETKINGRREKGLSGTGAVTKCTNRRLQLLLLRGGKCQRGGKRKWYENFTNVLAGNKFASNQITDL